MKKTLKNKKAQSEPATGIWIIGTLMMAAVFVFVILYLSGTQSDFFCSFGYCGAGAGDQIVIQETSFTTVTSTSIMIGNPNAKKPKAIWQEKNKVKIKAFTSGDLNDDGYDELIEATTNNIIEVAYPETYVIDNAGMEIWPIAAGDFNGDNKADVAVIKHHHQVRDSQKYDELVIYYDIKKSYDRSVVNLKKFDVRGGFCTGCDHIVGMAAGDFDGDGKKDIALAVHTDDYAAKGRIDILTKINVVNKSYEYHKGVKIFPSTARDASLAAGRFGDGNIDGLVYAEKDITTYGGGLSVIPDPFNNLSDVVHVGGTEIFVPGLRVREVITGDFQGNGKTQIVFVLGPVNPLATTGEYYNLFLIDEPMKDNAKARSLYLSYQEVSPIAAGRYQGNAREKPGDEGQNVAQ